MTLGEKINYYRKLNKLSQEALAEQIGVSRQAVSKWELNEATPELDKVVALAKTFSITTDELLSSDDPTPKRETADNPLHYDINGSGSSHRRTTTGTSGFSSSDFDRYGKHLGGLIRRKGWMAGYIISLYGIPPFLMGAIFSFIAGQMNKAANQMMGGFGSGLPTFPGSIQGVPDGSLIIVEGAESYYYHGAEAASSIFSLPQAIGVIIMLIGLAMIIGGIILARTLKKKMENRD